MSGLENRIAEKNETVIASESPVVAAFVSDDVDLQKQQYEAFIEDKLRFLLEGGERNTFITKHLGEDKMKFILKLLYDKAITGETYSKDKIRSLIMCNIDDKTTTDDPQVVVDGLDSCLHPISIKDVMDKKLHIYQAELYNKLDLFLSELKKKLESSMEDYSKYLDISKTLKSMYGRLTTDINSSCTDLDMASLPLWEDEKAALTQMFIEYDQKTRDIIAYMRECINAANEKKKQEVAAKKRHNARMAAAFTAALTTAVAWGSMYHASKAYDVADDIVAAGSTVTSAVNTKSSYGDEFRKNVSAYLLQNNSFLYCEDVINYIIYENGMGHEVSKEAIKAKFWSQVYLWGDNLDDVATYLFENQPLKEGTGTDSDSGTDTDESKAQSFGTRTMKIY